MIHAPPCALWLALARLLVGSSNSLANPLCTVTLREFDSMSRLTHGRSLPLLVSFPSVHITSTLVCNYVADQLNLELVGELQSPDFPTRAVVTDGQPSHGLRLVGNEQVMVLLCEFKLPPNCLGYVEVAHHHTRHCTNEREGIRES